MDSNIFRYIWSHTRREQAIILLIVLVSMVPYYMAFDLPKQIVNGPIQGTGFETEGATQVFLAITLPIPFVGDVQVFDGIPLERLPLLLALSLTFLLLVVVNNGFKFVINTYKGRLGERLLRRIRFELVDRILRFPPARFRQIKAGEVSSMVKDEVEPLGGFAGDAFVQPALLGGQALTALGFIFMQHFWLGTVAAVMAGIQVAIIPRMRRRLILLGRERQLTARELSGRVSDIVDGIATIHANDTTNWERADITSRLERIFRIRYDIYQWKFMVKFLNNFLAQVTPFLFYSIGGYLTIRGSVDVGQLVAVINAYKELPGPLKELIDWDLARQDMQVKYEQVIEQFDSEDLIDPSRHATPAGAITGNLAPLSLRGVTVTTEVGSTVISGVSLEVTPGETVAVIGGTDDGAPSLGEVLGGTLRPSLGTISLGMHDLGSLPESVTGQVISYATANGYFFAGSLLDNITYGLKHRPGPEPEQMDRSRFGRAWQRREAMRTGNPDLNLATDWIDPDSVQPRLGPHGLMGSVAEVLHITGLEGDVVNFAMRSVIPAARLPGIRDEALDLRQSFHTRLKERGQSHLVLRFDPSQFNAEATIGENLIFGIVADGSSGLQEIVTHPFFREAMIVDGLAEDLFDLGRQFATQTVEIFKSLQNNPELMEWLTAMTPPDLDLPLYQQVLGRVGAQSFAQASGEDRRSLIKLAFSYIEPRYRLGLVTEDLRNKIIVGRERLRQMMPTELRPLVQHYDSETYLVSATLLENVLFGKVNHRVNNAEATLRELGRELLLERLDLRLRILELGLEHDIGPGGRRLNNLQRQRVGLARILLRKSLYYVMNEPLAGADPKLQQQLIKRILAFLAQQPQSPAVLWVLANAQLAQQFTRTIEFSRGQLLETERDVANNDQPSLRMENSAS